MTIALYQSNGTTATNRKDYNPNVDDKGQAIEPEPTWWYRKQIIFFTIEVAIPILLASASIICLLYRIFT